MSVNQEFASAFPILKQSIRGKRLVYLDSAATSLTPDVVVDAIADYYRHQSVSVHRGAHYLSEEVTGKFEGVRRMVAEHIGAESSEEIIFTSGTTGAINIVAQSFSGFIKAGDEIIISAMEHHSNIVPWQMLCERRQAPLQVVPVNSRGELDLEVLAQLISSRTKLIALVHVSNSLGTVNPIAKITALAKAANIPVLVDGAQSMPHMAVDVRALGVDFFACSAHKMYGPTGLGVLYMRKPWLEKLPPVIGGGNMIRSVKFTGTTYAEGHAKFEAGTPHIAGVLGLGAAIEFINRIGLAKIAEREARLLAYAEERLRTIAGLRIIGQAAHKAAVVSFVFEDIHPHDVGTILDQEGIAVRAGHHCCQPIMERFQVPATTRASFGVYNSEADIESLVQALQKVQETFA